MHTGTTPDRVIQACYVFDASRGCFDGLRPHIEPVDHGRREAGCPRPFDVPSIGALNRRATRAEALRNAVEGTVLCAPVEPTDNPSRNLGAFGELSDVGHVFPWSSVVRFRPISRIGP